MLAPSRGAGASPDEAPDALDGRGCSASSSREKWTPGTKSRRVGSAEKTSAAKLVTDVDHVLLAASAGREAEWGVSAASLRGRSLWPAASPQIRAAEAALETGGWWERAAPAPVTLELDAHDEGFLPIVPGRMIRERAWLADGRPARLCTLASPRRAPPVG